MTVTAKELATLIAKVKPTAPAPRAAPWCRANCGERLDPVLANNDGSGLHLGCEEPAQLNEVAPESLTPRHRTFAEIRNSFAQVTPTEAAATPEIPEPAEPETAPPSTIDELRGVLIGYDASRPRSMQVRLGPSELGTPCRQQMARKLAGAPQRPVSDPTWAPFQGTAVHAEMEKVVAYWNSHLGRERWLAEDELTIDEEIRGHGDAFDTDTDMVVDWKHVGTTALTKLATAKRLHKSPAEQVSQEYRVQAHIYGLGHEIKGRRVRWVRLVLLARSWQYDDSDEWTEAYNPGIVDWALKRYYATKDLLTALDISNNPDLITAVQATPGNACGFCPFKRLGQPSDWHGCAGDEAASARRLDRFSDGLTIPSSGA